EHLLHQGCFSCLREAEDHMKAIGQHPDIVIDALDVELRLVNVNERAGKKPRQHRPLGGGIILRQIRNEINECRVADLFPKQVIEYLPNHIVWKSQGNSLVYRPSSKTMAVQAASQATDARRDILLTALRTSAYYPHKAGNRLSASILGK